MNIKKHILLTIVLSLIGINNTYAACTQEEINAFKRIEDDYTVKYEFDKTTKKYSLYFTATKPAIYDFTISVAEIIECENINTNTTRCDYLSSGTHIIKIKGQTETCDDTLKTINLELPKYNALSEDPLCEGIEEFVLCNPTYNKEIDYDSFVSRVETYKKNHTSTTIEDESSEEKNKNTNETLNQILMFLKENWIETTIIIVFIVLVAITTIITIKSVRKSRYLE